MITYGLPVTPQLWRQADFIAIVILPTNSLPTTTNNNARSNMSKATQSHLLTLADELLLKVVEQIESKNDLAALSLTCSRVQAFAEPFLYKSILVRQGEHARRLCYALDKRPARASSIRKLRVPYLHEHKEGIETLNQALRTMSSLQELNIESPCCNDARANTIDFESKGRIDYADYLKFASSMTPETSPRVQVPLQTCEFSPGSTLFLLIYYGL